MAIIQFTDFNGCTRNESFYYRNTARRLYDRYASLGYVMHTERP